MYLADGASNLGLPGLHIHTQRRNNEEDFDESAHEVASQTTWNLTAGYNITDSIKVKGGVVNLFDAGPNFDPTATSWPHYQRSVYNARGREWFLEGEVKF